MMRKHSRYDAPDKWIRKPLGQNHASVSSSNHLDKRTTRVKTSITHSGPKSRTTMELNQPANCNSVIPTTTSTFVRCICLFLVLIITAQTSEQQNTQLCPKVCTCDEQTLEVSCNGPFDAAGLPHTLNPSTKRITINHAQTTQFTSSDLDYFRSLELLDLAFNKLTAIDFDHIKSNTNLISLNASHNNIVELKDSAATSVISKLSNPGSTNNLSSITELDEYKKLRRSKINVVELDISYNQVTVLKNFTFMRWHRLQKLRLSHNAIEVLEQESLFGLSKLEHLILRGNRISQIPASAMHFLTRSPSYTSSADQTASSLEVIDLSENPLSAIEAGSFSSLTRLKELYLDSCLINNIDPTAFVGLNSLTTISLANNDIVEVPSDALSLLITLKALSLNSNDIKVLPSYAFKSLFNLEELKINNGSLFAIEEAAFQGLISLKTLQLNFNPNLTRIGATIFNDLPKLMSLSIQMGSLTSLAASEHIAKHPLALLDLRGNPLICDCNLKWLTNSLKKLNDTLMSLQQDKTGGSQAESHTRDLAKISINEMLNITCAGPSALAGKHIINLPDNKLECLKPNSKLNVHIGFASLFFMILTLTTVCLINFCRNEKHLMVMLKENIVNNRISMMLPYGHHDAHKGMENYRKETQIECSEYEPIDYGQNYGPIYTVPTNQYTNESSAKQQTQRM